jgi:hypothetical protein
MNLIQRQSLADAIGVSVYQLNKMYKQQKQLGQETGFFNKS